MVVSSISLKQISLHRCLAEGLCIASKIFQLFWLWSFAVTSHGSVAMDTVNKGGYRVKNCIVKF